MPTVSKGLSIYELSAAKLRSLSDRALIGIDNRIHKIWEHDLRYVKPVHNDHRLGKLVLALKRGHSWVVAEMRRRGLAHKVDDRLTGRPTRKGLFDLERLLRPGPEKLPAMQFDEADSAKLLTGDATYIFVPKEPESLAFLETGARKMLAICQSGDEKVGFGTVHVLHVEEPSEERKLFSATALGKGDGFRAAAVVFLPFTRTVKLTHYPRTLRPVWAPEMYETELHREKHLEGQHDQSDHASGGGAAQRPPKLDSTKGTGSKVSDVKAAEDKIREKFRTERATYQNEEPRMLSLGRVKDFYPGADEKLGKLPVWYNRDLAGEHGAAGIFDAQRETISLGRGAFDEQGSSGGLGETFMHEVEHAYDKLNGIPQQEFTPRFRQMLREARENDDVRRSFEGRRGRDNAEFHVSSFFSNHPGHTLTAEEKGAAVDALLGLEKGEVEKHGDHDQSTHGRGRGGGSATAERPRSVRGDAGARMEAAAKDPSLIRGIEPHSQQGIGAALVVSYKDGGKAIYKPDRLNEDGSFPEQAAHELDRELGLGVVPETRTLEYSEGRGSVQDFVEGKSVGTSPESVLQFWNDAEAGHPDLEKIAALDLLSGNQDRHLGNVMRGKDGHYYAIDHNLAFFDDVDMASATSEPLRGLSADRKIPTSLKERVRGISDDRLREIATRGSDDPRYVDGNVRAALERRAKFLSAKTWGEAREAFGLEEE